MKPQALPDGLTPLETALIQTLQNMHTDVIKELRVFRIQFIGALIGMVVFLIGVVALLKGVDPRIAAEAVQAVAPISVDGTGSP
jgi:hypothetical protein